MSVIEKTIEVAVPRRTAYDQWTQFEEFPAFMDDIERVQQVDDKHLHWKGNFVGMEREWDTEIIHQEPDDRITWLTTQGLQNDGTVSFASVGPERTQVTMRLEFEPEGFAEKAADALHLVDLRVSKDLHNFKEFIETREAETGAWRGDIKPTGDVDPGPDQRLV